MGTMDCFSLIRTVSCLARSPTLEKQTATVRREKKVGFLLFTACLSLLFLLQTN